MVEVAASSASVDLNAKLNAYRRNGVKEYLVWQIYENQIRWFQLQDSEYVELEPEDGVIKSRVFPGLWLAIASLQQGDIAAVLANLQIGLSSPEHQEFRNRLS